MPEDTITTALEAINTALLNKPALVATVKELTASLKEAQAKVKELEASLVDPRKVITQWFTDNPSFPHGDYKSIRVTPVTPSTYKAVVTDASLLPKEYVSKVIKVDTKAVRAALSKEGATLEGAERVPTPPYIKCTVLKP